MNLRWKIAQAAEIRWWQHYLKNKPQDNYLAWKHEYWQNFLQQLDITVPKEASVLDAGCGPAGIFMLFDQQKVTAVDPLLDAYHEKIQHFKAENYPNVDFHAQALEDFNHKAPYDFVFCLNAINHVADLELCFDKLTQLVKPNGTLVVSIDAHNYSFFKYLFRTLPGDILHPHQYDLAEYENMLQLRNCTPQKSVLIKKEFFFNYYALVSIKK